MVESFVSAMTRLELVNGGGFARVANPNWHGSCQNYSLVRTGRPPVLNVGAGNTEDSTVHNVRTCSACSNSIPST